MATTEKKDQNSVNYFSPKRLLMIAIVLGLIAALGTYLYLKLLEERLRKELTPPPKSMEQVVVASHDLGPGSPIDGSTMALRSIPKEYVEKDAVTPEQYNSIKGGRLKQPLAKGKILSMDYVDYNIPKDFSGTIRSGYRAMTIEVGSENSVAGLIRPGNRIDLFGRLPASTGSNRNVAGNTGEVVVPVLENVTVLATDRKYAGPNVDDFRNLGTEKPSPVYSLLTLEVTPKDAALIEIARARGSLLAVLRNKDDKSEARFARIGGQDITRNADRLESEAKSRADMEPDTGGALGSGKGAGVHRDAQGRLVTSDGRVITDPHVHLNSRGQLVTDSGLVLSGHGLHVGKDGRIYDANGRLVDTASLKEVGGRLVDKNGPIAEVRGSKGSAKLKKLSGGFLEDGAGNVYTPDGRKLSGVTVDAAGRVLAPDGAPLLAKDIRVDAKGRLLKKGGLQIGPDGLVRDSSGRPVSPRDLVRVDADGTVRTPDGKILKGWKVDKDGNLIDPEGKKADGAEVLLAEKGLHKGPNGDLLDESGKKISPKDLVTVDPDGTIRSRSGKLLPGLHLDKDGKLRDGAGHLVTAGQLAEEEAAQTVAPSIPISGVHAGAAGSLPSQNEDGRNGLPDSTTTGEGDIYRVEYILGGSSPDGTAKTVSVEIDDSVTEQGADDAAQ